MESGTIARLPGSAEGDGSGHELMFFGPLKDEAAVRAAAGQLSSSFEQATAEQARNARTRRTVRAIRRPSGILRAFAAGAARTPPDRGAR